MNRITILALSTALLAAPTVSSANHGEMTSTFVESFDGTLIDINVCRPAGADASNPVPVVLQSHGWGGQKSDCSGRDNYFNAGIGFVSMTQRGNTGSGGENNVMDPDFEGRDISAVLDHIASLDWVLKDDGPGGIDPVVGGLGGSYGGGFQWVGAFTDQWLRDAPTRFNSLRPGNTWYDLRESLAPNGVMRSVIVGGLYAGGVRNNNLAPWVHAAMA
ncbi:MAG: CocE/NonD family hydrolase, partial [Actinomycetota bacterium]